MKHFLDVGAMRGQTFDWFLLKTHEFDQHKIWCFEPSPRHLSALIDRVRALPRKFAGIVVCPFGLGGQTITVPFYEKSNDWSGDSFMKDLQGPNGPLINQTSGYELLCYTMKITEFLAQHTQPNDTFTLKLDCEGSEYAILYSLYNSEFMAALDGIYVEFHNTHEGWKATADGIIEMYQAFGKPITPWKL